MLRNITSLVCALSLAAVASAQNSSRLIGTHTMWFDTSWEISDSTNIVYSNGNGGDYFDLINQRLKYDTTHMVGWDGSAYVPFRHVSQKLDAQNRVTERLFVSLYPATVNDEKITYTYDPNGNLLEELNQDWVNNAWVNTFHQLKTFDANNNTLTQKAEYWGGTGWASSYLTVFSYDNNNNMARSVSATLNQATMQYDTTFKSELHYNSNNKSDTTWTYSWNNGWIGQNKSIYIYNSSNNYYDYEVKQWNAGTSTWDSWLQGFKLLNSLNLPAVDSTQKWSTYHNAWVNMNRSLSSYDNNNDPVAYLYQIWDTLSSSFVNDYVDSSAHNALHQVTWMKRQTWNATTQSWGGAYANRDSRYYYELYTSDVKGFPNDVSKLNIFPSPARGQVNIALSWNKPQNFTVAVYDMQGRLIRQWGEKAAKDYTTTIPVSDLSSGTYILEIRGKETRAQQQFMIMQ